MSTPTADIGHLSNLQPVEAVNLDDYPEQKRFVLAPAGRYTVQAPESFPPTAFEPTKAGFFGAYVDPTIVTEGPGKGKTLRFTKLSAKTYKRGEKTVSQISDYLKACGKTGIVPTEPQGIADEVASTAGEFYEVDLDWRVYNKRPDGSTFVVDGMKNFPRNADGTYQSWIEDPQDVDPEGNPKRLLVKLYVKRFVPRS